MANPALDLAGLMSDATATSESILNAGAAAQSGYNEAADIATRRSADAQATKDAAEQIKSIELQDKARQQAAIQRHMINLGTNPAEVGELLSGFGQRAIEADKQIQEASSTLAKIDSMSFLENPIGFLVAHMDRNKYVSQYYAAEQNRDSARATAVDLQRLTTDGVQNINAQSNTISDAYVAASKVVAGHAFQQEAYQSAIDAKRYNIEGIQAAANASRDALNIQFNSHNAQMGYLQYQNALEHTRISRAQFDLSKQAHDEKVSEDSLIARYIQTGFVAMNGKPMDSGKVKDFVLMYKAKNPDIIALFNSGLDSDRTGHSIISTSPFDASTLVMTGRVSNLTDAQKKSAEQLVTWRRTWEKTDEAKAALADSKDKTAAERSFNQWVKIQPTDQGGIFAPLGAVKAVTNNTRLASLPVWKTILEPATQAGVNVDDPNTAFGLVLAGMNSGKISYLDAIDYSQIIAGGLALSKQSNNFLTFGMPIPTGFKAEISVPGTFGKTIVNVADQNEVATVLNKAQAMRMANAGALGIAQTLIQPTITGQVTGVRAFDRAMKEPR